MMKPMRLFLPLCGCALLLLAGESIPAQNALIVDPAQTRVEFTLGSTLHTIHGSFLLKRGSLRFDPATGKVSGELVVDATSGDSGSHARDHRMHASILESTQYPEIVFRPDRVEGKIAPQGKSQVHLHGIFSIHGAEHEMTLPMTVDAGGGEYSADTTFVIPYVKWGMKNPSTLFLRVNDKVELTIHSTAHSGT